MGLTVVGVLWGVSGPQREYWPRLQQVSLYTFRSPLTDGNGFDLIHSCRSLFLTHSLVCCAVLFSVSNKHRNLQGSIYEIQGTEGKKQQVNHCVSYAEYCVPPINV